MTRNELEWLDALTPAQRQHGLAVEALIRRELQSAGGWLSFEQFMDLVLYAPGLGYYSAGSIKIGAHGDFTTAPEVSALFGQGVAQQLAQILKITQGSVLEIGAGTGRFASCLLTTLAELDCLPDHYWILEVSADLRERQRQEITQLPKALAQRVVWLDHLPQKPVHGVILANEVLDALPVARFVLRSDGLDEIGISLNHDDFIIETARPAGAQLSEGVAAIATQLPAPLPNNYSSEVCMRLEPWLSTISAVLARGAILLFDYGLPRSAFYHPARSSGTFRCHFKHRAHQYYLCNFGLQDLTAWVDFTAVAEAADAAGLAVAGFTSQAAFLLATGIEARVAQAGNDIARLRLASEARQLLLPGEMGEAFKAMALTRDLPISLTGFSLQDARHTL
jgi:SAM-dependent MidA family methyltransferase